MGKYNITRSELWNDKEVSKLSIGGKLLYVYLLSSPHSNIAGYYHIPIKRIKGDLCRYNEETDTFFKEDIQFFNKDIYPALIEQEKLWMYDKETEQVFIPTYLKHNKIGGPKQLKAIDTCLKTLSVCPLHIEFLNKLIRYTSEDALMYLDPVMLKEVKSLLESIDNDIYISLLNIINSYLL